MLARFWQMWIEAPGLMAEFDWNSDVEVSIGIPHQHPACGNLRTRKCLLQIQDRGEADVASGKPRFPFIAAACSKGLRQEGLNGRMHLTGRLGCDRDQIRTPEHLEQRMNELMLHTRQHDMTPVAGFVDAIE